jgi:hypothetical protein
MATQNTSEQLPTGGMVPSAPDAYQDVLADLSAEEVTALRAIQSSRDAASEEPAPQAYDGALQRTNFVIL